MLEHSKRHQFFFLVLTSRRSDNRSLYHTDREKEREREISPPAVTRFETRHNRIVFVVVSVEIRIPHAIFSRVPDVIEHLSIW